MAAFAASLPAEDDGPPARTVRFTTLRHRDWLSADERREQLRALMADYFGDVDGLLMPVAVVPAIPHDQSEPFAKRMIQTDGGSRPYTDMFGWVALATVAYLPATVVPVGRTAAGLPVGLQIVLPCAAGCVSLLGPALYSARARPAATIERRGLHRRSSACNRRRCRRLGRCDGTRIGDNGRCAAHAGGIGLHRNDTHCRQRRRGTAQQYQLQRHATPARSISHCLHRNSDCARGNGSPCQPTVASPPESRGSPGQLTENSQNPVTVWLSGGALVSPQPVPPALPSAPGAAGVWRGPRRLKCGRRRG
jgi:hypothetical protein